MNVVEDDLGLSSSQGRPQNPARDNGSGRDMIKTASKLIADRSDDTPRVPVMAGRSVDLEVKGFMKQEITNLSLITMALLNKGEGDSTKVLPKQVKLSGSSPGLVMAQSPGIPGKTRESTTRVPEQCALGPSDLPLDVCCVARVSIECFHDLGLINNRLLHNGSIPLDSGGARLRADKKFRTRLPVN